jgi:hypothetical protein
VWIGCVARKRSPLVCLRFFALLCFFTAFSCRFFVFFFLSPYDRSVSLLSQVRLVGF